MIQQAVLTDTGPLLAISDLSDQYHGRARREAEQLRTEGKQIAVAHSTVLESYSLIQRRVGLSTAQRWLVFAETELALLNPSGEDYALAFRQVRRYQDQDISLFDAVVSVLAKRFDTLVWTFDHHFDVMGVPVWRGEDA